MLYAILYLIASPSASVEAVHINGTVFFTYIEEEFILKFFGAVGALFLFNVPEYVASE